MVKIYCAPKAQGNIGWDRMMHLCLLNVCNNFYLNLLLCSHSEDFSFSENVFEDSVLQQNVDYRQTCFRLDQNAQSCVPWCYSKGEKQQQQQKKKRKTLYLFWEFLTSSPGPTFNIISSQIWDWDLKMPIWNILEMQHTEENNVNPSLRHVCCNTYPNSQHIFYSAFYWNQLF